MNKMIKITILLLEIFVHTCTFKVIILNPPVVTVGNAKNVLEFRS